MDGRPELHDESVASALKEVSHLVDVILLAQASMSRVANQLSEEDIEVPILSSPELAVQYLAEIRDSANNQALNQRG
jgi:Asp/Glu/hydantoin racemase